MNSLNCIHVVILKFESDTGLWEVRNDSNINKFFCWEMQVKKVTSYPLFCFLTLTSPCETNEELQPNSRIRIEKRAVFEEAKESQDCTVCGNL